MSLREEQCNKVCRILDNVLANRPTERDSLIVAVRKAFKALAEPSQVSKDIARIVENEQDMRVIAQPGRIKGHWIEIALSNHTYKCSVCGRLLVNITDGKNNVAKNYPYCHCGADMREEKEK